MTAKLHVLPVGRGDSFVIEIPRQGEKPWIILIDGGDTHIPESRTPRYYFESKGWTQIDLLVLTHIHPDHLNGLLPVVEQVQVKQAMLPYPSMQIELDQYSQPQAIQTQGLLAAYEQLQLMLVAQGTELIYRHPFGVVQHYVFGDYELRQLAPFYEAELKGYSTLQQLQKADDNDKEALLVTFDNQSNEDSTILLLSHVDGTQLVLLSGDATLNNWPAVLGREQLRPQVFKVGHHGLADAWNEELLEALQPKWVLITNNHEEYSGYKEGWNQLCRHMNCSLFVTGECDEVLVSLLPQQPERIEMQ